MELKLLRKSKSKSAINNLVQLRAHLKDVRLNVSPIKLK